MLGAIGIEQELKYGFEVHEAIVSFTHLSPNWGARRVGIAHHTLSMETPMAQAARSAWSKTSYASADAVSRET
jgi:hypothetical protein